MHTHLRSFPTPRPPSRPRRRRLRVVPLVALIVTALFTFFATRPAQAAGLLVADGGFGGQLEIEEQAVSVTINNGIAVTQVDQTFRNTEDRIVEALYTFPVPEGASVANFSMWINGKEMIGEVVEKGRAREIYNSYKQQPKPRDPGLLEQTDYKTFEMRIFPIGPRAEQRVRLTYYQQLDYDHDRTTYVYPLSSTASGEAEQRTTGRFALDLRVLSEVPIDTVESPSHPDDFAFAQQGEKVSQASLEVQGGSLARDVVVSYQATRPHTGIDLIASKPEKDDGYFMLTLTAGEELEAVDAPMDYVFIVDASGSMAMQDKLAMSRSAVEAFVEALGPEDRFEVMAFDVQPSLAFESLRSADEAAKAEASTFLKSQRARGGTILAPALTTAYRYADAGKDRPLNVVVLSDGMTEQRERTELLQQIRNRPANTRVFCIGVGNEVDRPLLEELAKDSGGLAAFISRGDHFERQAQAFRRKLTRPVASDLKIDITGVKTYDVEPATLPALYHGQPLRIFGRYTGGGDAQATITGRIAGQAMSNSVDIRLPVKDAEPNGGNPEIERMWAYHRIHNLLADADRKGARTGVVGEVVKLGELYSIVTQYTSFIVLENDGEYQRWKIDRRNALRIDRDRRAQQATQARLDQLRDKALAAIGPAPDTTLASNTAPIVSGDAVGQPNRTNATPGATTPRNRDGDIDWGGNRGGGGGGGGGAIDPFTLAAVVGLGGAAMVGGWRRKRRRDVQRA